jgi:enamine deaminase RidA (YjgF/YER057c/UK114 family)
MTRQLISSGSTFEQEIGYSRAVVDGDWVFISGTTGLHNHVDFGHVGRAGNRAAGVGDVYR